MIHSVPVLLPALSACPVPTSPKVIPCISREGSGSPETSTIEDGLPGSGTSAEPQAQAGAEDHVMHLPWPARQYERTCADCGYSWRVPRYFARRHGISYFLIGQGGGGFKSGLAGRAGGPAIDEAELNREIQSSAKMDERAESFRECPKCGSEQYSQRPVRS